jgi:hypothetical protein
VIRDVPARTVRTALNAKGFQPAEHCNRDHEVFFFHLDGRKTDILVKISRGATHLYQGEIRNNARNIRVAGAALYGIVSCELDANETRRIFCEDRR